MTSKMYRQAVRSIQYSQSPIHDAYDDEEDKKVELTAKFNAKRRNYFRERSVAIKGIPKFWSEVFLSHPDIKTLTDDEEKDCLGYLRYLEVNSTNSERNEFSVRLHFKFNPYFENAFLRKTVYVSDYFHGAGDADVSDTAIIWKPGYNLTCKVPTLIDDITGQPAVPFFAWFSNTQIKGRDYVKDAILKNIWPFPMNYYKVMDFSDEESDNEDVDQASGADDDQEPATKRTRIY